MTDKHSRRVKQCLDEILEEHTDLFNHVKTLSSLASDEAKKLTPDLSNSKKKAIVTFLRKILLVFSELNETALKCIEMVKKLEAEENILNISVESHGSTHELCDYMKGSLPLGHLDIHSVSEGPRVPNNEMLNDSYVRKPLNNVTLKAICTTIINNHSSTTESDPSDDPKVSESNRSLQDETQRSSLCSVEESDAFSTVSSHTFVHPLSKLEIPVIIPQQYNTSYLDTVKENLLYISRKMGLDCEQISETAKEFNKSSGNEERQIFSGQSYAQIVASDTRETNRLQQSELRVDDIPQKLEKQSYITEPENLKEECNNSINKTTTSAISKVPTEKHHLEEFASPKARSCEKVAAWLNNESSNENSDLSKSKCIEPVSIVQVLNERPRTDRHQLAKEKAMADMPDLKLISVPDEPKVIFNDLSPDRTENKNDVKENLKNYTNHCDFFEIENMDILEPHSICVFSHIESPAEFYLQMVVSERAEYLDLISSTLRQKFNKTLSPFNSKQEAFAKIGKYCFGCIWQINESWFRMQVLDWKLDSSKDDVDVQLVDYGPKCTTSYIHLRPLTDDLVHIPKLAIKCHFPLLYPPGSTYMNRLRDWPSNVTDFLYDMTSLSRNIMDATDVVGEIGFFEVVVAEAEGDSIAVDLVNYGAQNADTLGQMLIDMQLAVQIVDDYEQHPELGGFLSDIDELERPENLNEFILGYDARDELRICQFTRPDGSCFKGKHCKLEHIELKDGYTTDKTPVFCSAINDLLRPCKGDQLTILITGYLDSCTYLVQLVRDPVFKENVNVEMDREISDLMDAMNNLKIVKNFECFKVGPAEGEIILAFHPLAKQWMRVAVRQINTNQTYEVYAVDFGDQFIVPFKKIRVMKEEFMHVPFQALKVYLGNYQHKRGCDKNQAKKFFEMHMCFKTFLAKFESNDPPYRIRLTTLRNREIGPTLMKHGFAELRNFDINPSEDEYRRPRNGEKIGLE